MFKEEILKNAGLKESVIIREEPPKPPKKKRKKVNEKIKLRSLLGELLLEAVDVSDGGKVIRALERGQIPGVKKKIFLSTDKEEKEIISTLDQVINILKPRVNSNAFNSYLFLLLKKFGNIDSLKHNMNLVDEFIDAMTAYFGNVNKQEAKQNPQVRAKFEEFFNSPFSFEKAKEFEQWANEKFAHKAKAKDKDIVEVYRNNQGWTVHIPKTFGAASKLACMANRKARWCTSASNSMFKSYTSNNNPLYIIRNEDKNFLLQMDWGYDTGGKRVNFKGEDDFSIPFKSVMKLNVPDDVWKAIKNREGKSVYYYFQQAEEIKKEEEEKEKNKKSKAEELGEKINWEVEEENVDEISKKIQQIDKDIVIETRDSIGKKKIDQLSVEDILKDTLRDDRKKQKEIARGTKVFKFTSDKGRELYGVLGTVIRYIRKSPRSRPKRHPYTNVFLEVDGGNVKVIDKGDIISGSETGIPDELKKEFFKGTDFEKLESEEVKEIDGVFEINDLDFLLKKQDLFDDHLTFDRFKQELDNAYLEGASNIYIKKENNGNVSAVWQYGRGIHIVKYTKDKNTINYSNKYGVDYLNRFPDEVKNKILDSIEDEDAKNIFSSTVKENNFVHPLLDGEYYYDMINNNLLDKDKNVISSIANSNHISRKIKKEKSEEEYRKFLHQKSIITELKTGLKNTLEKQRHGFSGKVTLSKIRSNKDMFKEKLEKALEKPSIADAQVSDSEKKRIINEILNGDSNKIKLTETTMVMQRAGGRTPELYPLKIGATFPVELYYDENEERTQSDFYYVGTEEPYFAIGFVKSKRYGDAELKSQGSYLKDGKEKSHGYVHVKTKDRAREYVKFVKRLFRELKGK